MTSYEDQILAGGSLTGRTSSRPAPEEAAQYLRENQNYAGTAQRPLNARERMVLSLQLRGLKTTEIASTLRMQPHTVYAIQRRVPYQKEFNARLDECDQYFLAMKPKALGALESALDSSDELTGLRGAETWFKAMGYKGFGKVEAPAAPVSAEDIAVRLLAEGGGSVRIEVTAEPQVERSETRLATPLLEPEAPKGPGP